MLRTLENGIVRVYSLFDDVGRSRVFSRAFAFAGGSLAWARRRVAATAHMFFGLIGRQ